MGWISQSVYFNCTGWRRKLMALRHEVKLIHAKFVQPFMQGNKTDATDAKAIWTAVRQPGMRTVVAGKTEDQQAMLALHRMRLSLIKFRTMQVNQLREVMPIFVDQHKEQYGVEPICKQIQDCPVELLCA